MKKLGKIILSLHVHKLLKTTINGQKTAMVIPFTF